MSTKVKELIQASCVTNGPPPIKKEPELRTVTKKPSRKECEKMRRDKLNRFIGELADMVPSVMHAKKKMNKTGILRLTVNYLRLHQDLQKKNQLKLWRPEYIESNFPLEFLESNSSFLFVYNERGVLTYISENVSSLLGHNQIDLLGQPISSIIDKEYEDVVLQPLKGTELTATFNCKMLCACLKSHLEHYENVLVTGHVRRGRDQDVSYNLLGAPKDVYFVAVGKVSSKLPIHNIQPANSTPLDFSNSLQYVTRHFIDGSVENMDHRACMILGYLSSEAQGSSPYFSIHPNDLVFVAAAHQKVFEVDLVRRTVFRYVTCENKVLHVQSQTHLIKDQFTGKPKYLLSFNEVVSPQHGREIILEQRKALIKERKSKKRERISAGEVSDEVEKDEEGAIVHLVCEQELVSIAVPFDEFRKSEMHRDDLLITDDLTKNGVGEMNDRMVYNNTSEEVGDIKCDRASMNQTEGDFGDLFSPLPAAEFGQCLSLQQSLDDPFSLEMNTPLTTHHFLHEDTDLADPFNSCNLLPAISQSFAPDMPEGSSSSLTITDIPLCPADTTCTTPCHTADQASRNGFDV